LTTAQRAATRQRNDHAANEESPVPTIFPAKISVLVTAAGSTYGEVWRERLPSGRDVAEREGHIGPCRSNRRPRLAPRRRCFSAVPKYVSPPSCGAPMTSCPPFPRRSPGVRIKAEGFHCSLCQIPGMRVGVLREAARLQRVPLPPLLRGRIAMEKSLGRAIRLPSLSRRRRGAPAGSVGRLSMMCVIYYS
jgi:hypothetical protein